MTDPVAKAKAIERERLNAKRVAFQRLRQEAPDVAAFVQDVAQVFGKPAAVEIRFTDGTVFSTGEWGTT